MKREKKTGASRAMATYDRRWHPIELPRGPKFYTQEDIVRRAGERGTEAAKKPQADRRTDTHKETDRNA
jgi:hypothetical protein